MVKKNNERYVKNKNYILYFVKNYVQHYIRQCYKPSYKPIVITVTPETDWLTLQTLSNLAKKRIIQNKFYNRCLKDIRQTKKNVSDRLSESLEDKHVHRRTLLVKTARNVRI